MATGCELDLASTFLGGLIGVVIMVMTMIVALAYIGSKVFNIPSWEVFAKIELYEIFVSVLIFFAAVAFFQFGCHFSVALVGADPFEAANDFIVTSIYDGVYPALTTCYELIIHFSVINTFQIRPSDAVWTFTYKVAPGADLIANLINTFAYGLIAVFGSLSAQLLVLAFIKATMLNYFLPAGILMRFFPPTRQAGIFLITFAIAFYVIYPTSFAIHKKSLDYLWINGKGIEEGFAPFDRLEALEMKAGSLGTPLMVGALQMGLSKILPGSSVLTSFAGFLTGEMFIMTIQPYIISFLLDAIATLALVSFFLPALSMMTTIAFINGVSNFVISKT
ncbi:hypothetical protein JXB01_00175 [Candidatus Micrarchaeota archaeon]|nr:hypothetical protein [Candidatus Micrarchaeota archaeon]